MWQEEQDKNNPRYINFQDCQKGFLNTQIPFESDYDEQIPQSNQTQFQKKNRINNSLIQNGYPIFTKIFYTYLLERHPNNQFLNRNWKERFPTKRKFNKQDLQFLLFHKVIQLSGQNYVFRYVFKESLKQFFQNKIIQRELLLGKSELQRKTTLFFCLKSIQKSVNQAIEKEIQQQSGQIKMEIDLNEFQKAHQYIRKIKLNKQLHLQDKITNNKKC